MIESMILFLSSVPWEMVLLTAFLLTFVENVFPPAPCDIILVFMGTLVGIKVVDFFQLWLAATLGSVLGFFLVLYLGRRFGRKLIGYHRFKFLSEERLAKPNKWLVQYGYWIVLANRFLSGTRGIISFLAGMSHMKISTTLICGSISSIVWNAALIWLGVVLGNNWKIADRYLQEYSYIFIIGIVLIIGLIIIVKTRKKRIAHN